MDLTENKNKHSQDEMINEISDVLREIGSSNRFLLKRLNQSESSGSCACSAALQCNQKDIKDLQSKIVELEGNLKEKDKNQRELSRRFETLKGKVDLLETSNMAVQTDDSKLRSASLYERQKDNSSNSMKHSSAVAVKDKTSKQNNWKPKTVSDQSGISALTAVSKSVKHADPDILKAGRKMSEHASAQEKDKQEGANGGVSLQNNTTTSEADRTPPVSSKNTSISSVKESEKNVMADRSDSEKISREQPVEVLSSPERKSYGDERFWLFLAEQESEDAKKTLWELKGIHSVICLDISASMAEGDAWTQAKTFLNDYLKGLEDISMKYGLTDEHVAFVTFGHVTQVQKRFTNKYIEIRDLIGKQKLGGPSPLYGGLEFGMAAVVSSGCIISFYRH